MAPVTSRLTWATFLLLSLGETCLGGQYQTMRSSHSFFLVMIIAVSAVHLNLPGLDAFTAPTAFPTSVFSSYYG